MSQQKKSLKLRFIQNFFIILILTLQNQAVISSASSYIYSSSLSEGDTISWHITDLWSSGNLVDYQEGVYLTNEVYLPKRSVISIKIKEHPNDIEQNYPLILWNTTPYWYDLYINDTLVSLDITGKSLMTLGFLTFPYISPIKLQDEEEEINSFQYIVDKEGEFNHTSTGTLDETSEHPIDYVRSEILTTYINSTIFSAESVDTYKKTQVISENLTYIWTFQKKYNFTFDLTTGILKNQECRIKNVTKTIECEGNEGSIGGVYSWFVYYLVSNYTFPQINTDKTSIEMASFIISISLFCIVLSSKFRKKKEKTVF